MKRIISMLKEENVDNDGVCILKIGGMMDEKISDGRRSIGMKVKDLMIEDESYEGVVFAKTGFESKIMVGNLGVDIPTFESVAIDAIRNACEQCDLIVIDEVGKAEVESQAFVDAVKDALDVDKPMIITLHKKSRNPLLQDIRRRDDVRILEITPTNRNLLPHKIIKLMSGEEI
ncbi:MAG: nucleotide kinase [archaeon]|nr:nucleotide kinase [archaeon]